MASATAKTAPEEPAAKRRKGEPDLAATVARLLAGGGAPEDAVLQALADHGEQHAAIAVAGAGALPAVPKSVDRAADALAACARAHAGAAGDLARAIKCKAVIRSGAFSFAALNAAAGDLKLLDAAVEVIAAFEEPAAGAPTADAWQALLRVAESAPSNWRVARAAMTLAPDGGGGLLTPERVAAALPVAADVMRAHMDCACVPAPCAAREAAIKLSLSCLRAKGPTRDAARAAAGAARLAKAIGPRGAAELAAELAGP